MTFSVTWVDSLGSTNATLKASLAAKSSAPNQVLAARRQLAGRGRNERYWVCEPYRDLTCSILLHSAAPLNALPSLSMVVALGVREMLTRYAIAATVKWPNDVMVGTRKICGILSEALPDPAASNRHYLLVGVGLNVGMSPAWLAKIDQPATSMQVETGDCYAVDAVLEKLLAVLPPWLDRWELDGFEAIRAEWMAHEPRLHSRIRIGHGATTRQGILEGFGADGELLLRDAAGQLQVCIHGDVLTDAPSPTSAGST